MDIGITSLVGIIIGLFFFGFFAYKGYHLIPVALFCGFVVAVFSGLNPYEALSGGFMPSFSGFFKSYFLLFCAGSIFAKIMQECGAIGVVAGALSRVCHRFKGEKVQRIAAVMTIPLMNTVIVYGGINVFAAVFIVVHLGKELFKEYDIPWHYYGVGTLGTAVLSQFLPGSPELVNLVPIKYFGTTAMSGAFLGITAAFFSIVFAIIYVSCMLERTTARGEGFMPTGARILEDSGPEQQEADLPLWKCLIPMILVWVLLNLAGLAAAEALFWACIAACVLFYKQLGGKFKACLSEGTLRAVGTIALLSATVGFGGVVAATPGYAWVVELIQNSGAVTALQIALAVNILAGLTSSASGSMTIILNTFAESYISSGISVGALHRLIVVSSLGLNTLPHAAGVASIAATCKLKHNEFYHHVFWMSVVIPTVVSLIMVLMINVGIQF